MQCGFFLLLQLLYKLYNTIHSITTPGHKQDYMLFISSRQQLALAYSQPFRINNILINGNSSSIVAWTNHFKAFLALRALFFAPLTGYLRNNTARTNSSSHLPMIPRLLWLEGIGQWTGWPTFLWVGGEVHARWWAMCTFGLRAQDRQLVAKNKTSPEYTRPRQCTIARSKCHSQGPDPGGIWNCVWKCSFTSQI